MKKYTFSVTRILTNIYEIDGIDEKNARILLDDKLDDELNFDDYVQADTEITLIEVSDRPSHSVYLYGDDLIVDTANGRASINLSKIIDDLCAKAEGGNE